MLERVANNYDLNIQRIFFLYIHKALQYIAHFWFFTSLDLAHHKELSMVAFSQHIIQDICSLFQFKYDLSYFHLLEH